MHAFRPFVWLWVSLLLWATNSEVQAEVSQSDRELVKAVSERLLAVTDTHPDGLSWPPRFEVIKSPEPPQVLGEGALNAFAMLIGNDENTKKPIPGVGITQGMLDKIVQDDEDCLAFILGHEIAHHILEHTLHQASGKTPFTKLVFSRQDELAADQLGTQLALKAGYAYSGARTVWKRMQDEGLEYSSFEGFKVEHPSWADRLAAIDKEKAPLWRAMSAFQNGNLLLSLEQYAAAERCFRTVTREFPSCYEAWANLGYALLMQYCDGFDTDDLRHMDVGQIVVGGFYRRSESLEVQLKGVDAELWWEAVGALKTALRIKPELTLVKANLGLAYLLHPEGKDLGIGRATQYLQEAAAAAQADETLDSLTRSVVLINTGVADLAAGQVEQGVQRFDQSEAEIRPRPSAQQREVRGNTVVSSALLYNRARLLSASERNEQRRAAMNQFEEYLRMASPSSMWWPLAYEQYTRLCKALGLTEKTENELESRTATWRPLTSVRLDSGAIVTVSEPLDEVERRLGKVPKIPAVKRTNLVRMRYPDHGIELVATDRVMAICLSDPSSPVLLLRHTGLGTEAVELRVGMEKQELDRIIEYDGYRELDDPHVHYRFYEGIGLAVRVRDKRVESLVVAQIPRRNVFGTK